MGQRFFNSSLLAVVGLCFASGCAPAGNADLSSTTAPNGVQGTTPPTTPTTPPVPITPSPPSNPVVARPSSDANIRVCVGANKESGVDVSDYDPGTNWPSFKSGGGSFAFIKATEGTTYVSPIFAGDWSAAANSGVVRGAYHFFHPADDPTLQAQLFLQTLGTLGLNDLPPVFDWEVSDNQTVAVQISRAKTWLQLVEAATGRVPIIYLSPGFFNGLGNPQGFERYPLFIANYGVSCPDVPPPWSQWTFWQSSDTGGVTGIKTADVDHDTFNGSIAQLVQFVTTGSF